MSVIAGVAQDARAVAARADHLRARREGAGRRRARPTDEDDAEHGGGTTRELGRETALGTADGIGLTTPSDEHEPADVLHMLAVHATRLRVRAPAALALQEAAAARADLVGQVVGDDAPRLEARCGGGARRRGGRGDAWLVDPDGGRSHRRPRPGP